MAKSSEAMGIDIGGTGIKAAVVNLRTGTLVSERIRIKTPRPSTPDAVLSVVRELQQDLNWSGPVGVGFPGLVKGGTVHLAPHLDEDWEGIRIARRVKSKLGVPFVAVGNDADAAGLAEVVFGAGKGVKGTVVLITLGTGIGSAVFLNGVLMPNTELGHIELNGKDAERLASNSARDRKNWSWKKWGNRVDKYLCHLEYLLGADLFIIGGGVSKSPEKFFPYIDRVRARVVPASMGNQAGIVGAALFTRRLPPARTV